MTKPTPTSAPSTLDLGRLSKEERDELSALLERQHGGETFAAFVDRVTPREPLPDHVRVLADALQQARKTPLRICISMPPGHTKTVSCLRGVAWWLRGSPADTCAYVTYSDAQARSKSRLAREWAIAGGVEMSRDFTGLSEWRTAQGGGFLAAGARGKLTGQRVPGLLIVDDPYKNRDEVESPVVRERIYERFREVALTRLQGGSAIVMHTRWHDDDLIGKATRELGWDLVNLPAIAEDGDSLGRAPGEALWPDKYPATSCAGPCGHDGHLDEIARNVGAWSWASLYQGRPMPREGGLFRRKWFEVVDASDVPKGGRVVRKWDLAASTGERADYTAGVKMRLVAGKLYVEDVITLRGSPHTVDETILRTAQADGLGVRIALPQDPGQAGKAQKSHLGALLAGYTVEFTIETGSKSTRAEPFASQCEAGNVRIVRAGWNGPYLEELETFPASRHDDQVDASAGAYHALIRRPEPKDEFIGAPVLVAAATR